MLAINTMFLRSPKDNPKLSIILSNQTNLLEGNQPLEVQQIFRIRKNDTSTTICLRQGGRLIGLRYSQENDKWQLLWNKTVFAKDMIYSTKDYPWFVADDAMKDQSVIAIKTKDGVGLYGMKPGSSDIQFLSEDGHFHDVYGYELRIGFLYPRRDGIGVLARNPRGAVSFYAITQDSLSPGLKYPLFPLEIDLNLNPIWQSKSTDIFVTSPLNGGPDVIALRSASGLEFHQFDQKYSLVKLFSTSNAAKPTGQEDDIYFADITHNKYQDLLHLNSSGLYLYAYNNSDYNFVNRHDGFTQDHGWDRRYTKSILFTDLNGDNIDDLVFTGPKGLSALTFDLKAKTWTTLLDVSLLRGQTVYSNIVGIVNKVVFLQSPSGELLWGKLTQSPTLPTEPPPTEITPTERPQRPTKDCPVIPSMSIGRLEIDPKPVLRWVEQWDSTYLKDALHVLNGKPSFSLPLIDTFMSSGWGIKVDLSYSFDYSATFLGEGWSLPLAQDQIAVQKQGNVFVDNLQYKFILQGQSLSLELVSIVNGVKKYRSRDRSHDQFNTKFQFLESEKKWIVEDDNEKAIYGESDDAIHWSLAWPNWNGPGQDKEQLQPEISAWYLKERTNKHTGQRLQYSYKQDVSYISDDKNYTSGIWLNSITDGKQFRLNIEYGLKEEYEFIKYSPKNGKDDFRFPVTLTESKYITSLDIYTYLYKQNFKFHYDFASLKRRLTSISQQNETMLNFKYTTFSDMQYLANIEVPSIKLSAKFDYSSLKIPNHTFKYPVDEEPTFANGMNYTVLGYRKPKDKEIALKLLNSEMSYVLQDCTSDLHFSCPKLPSPEYKSVDIFAYKNSFVVISKSESGSVLYLYTRRGGVWSEKPKLYSFNEIINPHFNQKGFAVHRTSENKMLFFYNKEPNWVETNVDVKPNTRIAYLESNIVTYDDDVIRIFYTDKESWKEKVLYSIPGKSASKFADKFDWESDRRQEIVQTLDINTLQAMGNTIVISGISETSGQLASDINLFLLNPQFEVAKHQAFQINRQNLYDLKQSIDNDKKTIKFEIGYYVNDDGKFSMRVKDVSGSLFDDIKDESDRRKRKDELIKKSNEDADLKKNIRKAVFIDFGYFFNKLTSKGVVCNETFIQFTGAEWRKKYEIPQNGFNLGTAFSLKVSNKGKSVTLVNQENNELIKEFNLYSPNAFVNAYPLYIAYQQKPDSVEVLSFKDDKTLGPISTFDKEQLHSNNNGRSLITIANVTGSAEPKELRIRPATVFAPNDLEYMVTETEHSDGESKRKTGYKRNIIVQDSPFVIKKEFTQIPGNNPDEHGSFKVTYTTRDGNTTRTENWYDNHGQEVPIPEKDKNRKRSSNQNFSSALLYDKSRSLVISDFTPLKLQDQMVAYYGFEDYETSDKFWTLKNSEIVREKFSFTGRNHLQLKSSSEPAFLEGALEPKNQNITYIASCWLRPSSSPDESSPSPLMKAVITTPQGEEIIGLLSEIKNQIDGWYYLELILNFKTIGEVYMQYISHKNRQIEEFPKFRITLRIEAPLQQAIDVDHIRFSPLLHNFIAKVFHPLSGKETETIQLNGLVTKHFYNRLGEKIAVRKENGEFTLMSYSRTGELERKPEGVTIKDSKPNLLTITSHTATRESFDLRNFCNRWNIDHLEAWKFSPGQIWHVDSQPHRIEANSALFDAESSVLRFYYTLIDGSSNVNLIWKEIGSINISRRGDSYSRITLPGGKEIEPLPSSGELIVKIDKSYAWIWLNGVMIFDRKLKSNYLTPWSKFSIEAKGHVLVEDIITLNRPSVKIEYINGFGEKTQVVELEEVDSAVVTETIYDDVGRGAIITKPTRIQRKGDEELLAYRPKFAVNKDPHVNSSVWKTGKLEGEINELNPVDEGFAYTRTKYAPNPLNQQMILGMAGKEFSISGKYSTKVYHKTDMDFINNLFPVQHGYYYRVRELPNGSWRVFVFDKKKNQRAHYMRVPGYDHSLSTYDYDEHNRLIRILPPSYHEKAKTAERITPWDTGVANSPDDHTELESALGIHLEYDKKGNLVKKKTPDTNTVHYSYNAENQPTQLTFLGDGANHTVLMEYDVRGQLLRSGYVKSSKEKSTGAQGMTIEGYQRFYYSYNNANPLERGRLKQCVTQHGNETVIEKLHFDMNGKIILKNTIASFYIDDEDNFKDFKKQYKGDKVHTMSYPITYKGEPLRVVHTYNNLGQLVGLGKINSLYFYARITYQPDRQIASIEHLPGSPHSYTRRYEYNSPGFIAKVSDPYLSQTLAYTEGGYGQEGFGDGMAMKTAYNATWYGSADTRWFQIRDEHLDKDIPSGCIGALKRLGYLTANGLPLKSFVPAPEIKMPLICGGRTSSKLANLISKKQPVKLYGHLYAYGNHQQLTKAKYFTEETADLITPLQPFTFSKKIAQLKDEDSLRIWNSLKEGGFIYVDQKRYETQTAIGKRGSTILRDDQIREDLTQLNKDFLVYMDPIKRLLTSCLAHGRSLSVPDFENIFLQWENVDSTTPKFIYNKAKDSANTIGSMLQSKGYFTSNPQELTKILNDKFVDGLSQYSSHIPEIVKILSQHFNHALGESPFDLESYDIDANGNHRLFYNGFDRYNISYRENSNQIESVQVSHGEGPLFMKHDHRGNTIQAFHKGIKHIEYHPVSQRTMRIQLTNGSEIRFFYDTNGERILKRFLDSQGKVKHETHYLRDEEGRVLMDKKIIYEPGNKRKTVSAYLYGPNGLLGFVRGDSYYSIVSDHMRSVRLVIQNGKVVAAYDYLPYGETSRIFGDDPEAHVSYRFSGQEWDEETGLYNFHARLYDPAIGRFFQPDPKMQYFSPYKYSGNSPISLHDPDGQFVLMVTIAIFVVAGAYLGGAAANNSFNPLDWNFKSLDTWKGMIIGGIIGGLIPVSFVGLSAGAIAAGLAFNFATTFVSLAVENHTWNPAKWNWKSPSTYYSIFSAFQLDSDFVKGLSGMRKITKAMKGLKSGKGLKSLLKFGFQVGMLIREELLANPDFFTQMDFTDPKTYAFFLKSLQISVSKFKGYAKPNNRFKRYKKVLKTTQTIVDKGSKGGEMVMGLLQSSNQLDFNMIDSYQDFVDGELQGEDTDNEDDTDYVVAKSDDTEVDYSAQYSEGPEAEDKYRSPIAGFMEKSVKLVKRSVRNQQQKNIFKGSDESFYASSAMKLGKELTELAQSELGIRYIYPDRDVKFLSCQNVNGACFVKVLERATHDETDLVQFTSNFHNISSHINKRDLKPLITDNRNTHFESERQSYDSHATSSSSKPRLWAYQVFETALAVLSFRGRQSSRHEPAEIGEEFETKKVKFPLKANEFEIPYGQQYYAGSFDPFEGNGPSVLEMGDELTKNADMNGFLLWCGVLARKWTGFKPLRSKASNSYSNSEQYTIRSHQIVEEFAESMEKFLIATGISSEIVDELIDIKTYNETIREVRRKFAERREEEIPKYLFTRLITRNIKRLTLLNPKLNLDLLLKRMREHVSSLEEQLKEEDRDGICGQTGSEKYDRNTEDEVIQGNVCSSQGFPELFGLPSKTGLTHGGHE